MGGAFATGLPCPHSVSTWSRELGALHGRPGRIQLLLSPSQAAATPDAAAARDNMKPLQRQLRKVFGTHKPSPMDDVDPQRRPDILPPWSEAPAHAGVTAKMEPRRGIFTARRQTGGPVVHEQRCGQSIISSMLSFAQVSCRYRPAKRPYIYFSTLRLSFQTASHRPRCCSRFLASCRNERQSQSERRRPSATYRRRQK